VRAHVSSSSGDEDKKARGKKIYSSEGMFLGYENDFKKKEPSDEDKERIEAERRHNNAALAQGVCMSGREGEGGRVRASEREKPSAATRMPPWPKVSCYPCAPACCAQSAKEVVQVARRWRSGCAHPLTEMGVWCMCGVAGMAVQRWRRRWELPRKPPPAFLACWYGLAASPLPPCPRATCVLALGRVAALARLRARWPCFACSLGCFCALHTYLCKSRELPHPGNRNGSAAPCTRHKDLARSSKPVSACRAAQAAAETLVPAHARMHASC
jgi:hypothetical protein